MNLHSITDFINRDSPIEIVDQILSRNKNLRLILVCHNILGFESGTTDRLLERPNFASFVMGAVSDKDFEKLLQIRAAIAGVTFSDTSLNLLKEMSGSMIWEALTLSSAIISDQKEKALNETTGRIELLQNDKDMGNVIGVKHSIESNFDKIWTEALTVEEKALLIKIVKKDYHGELESKNKQILERLESFGLIYRESNLWHINGKIAEAYFKRKL